MRSFCINKIHLSYLVLIVLIGLLIGAQTTLAVINPQMNYQGKLTTPSGVAVPDGTYNMRFWLLDSPSVATSSALWTETLTGANKVTVSNGLFSIMLGSTTPLTSVDFNQTLYLGVEIGGTSTPAWDGEMSPRKILGTVPAAFIAETAVSAEDAFLLGGVASTSFLRADEADTLAATSTGSLITLIQNGVGAVARFFSGATEVFTILNNGNVGVGTSTPSAKFAVSGNALITGTSTLATTTANNLTLTQALAVTSGGTGANNAAGARISLGATTVGSNLFTLTNPSAVTLIRINADNTVSAVATSTLGIAISDTTGTLAATRGGTGLSTITQNQLLIGGAGNTWTQVATSALGLLSGPTSSVDNSIVRFDGTTGKIVQGYTSGTPTISDTGDITARNIEAYRMTVAANESYNISPTSALSYLAYSPGSKYLWHDLVAFSNSASFGTPTFERFDGGWSTTTVQNGIFAQKEDVSFTIIDGTTHTGARWTWNNSNVPYSTGQWVMLGVTYNATSSSKDFLIETSADGSIWTTRHTSTANLANATPVLLNVSSYGGDTYFRVTVTVTNGQPLRLSTLKVLSPRWGDQGGGSEYEYPYAWDGDRRIAFGSSSVPANGIVTIGTNTTDAASGLYFGTDTNLYRSAANTLRTDDLLIASSGLSVGTTSSPALLTIAGTGRFTGALTLDTALSATSGGTSLSTITQNQLLIGGAGNTWTQVSTSSLGLGNGTFLGLSDTPSAYTANRLFFTNVGGTAVTDSTNLTFDGTQLAVNGNVRSGYFTATSTTGTSTFAGRVGIGTTTPFASSLTMQQTGISGTSTAGIGQYFEFINSVANQAYFGNQTNIFNTPTATSTLVGSILRITDNSALGNTVRGLEVQANRGTNTLGENTGISGFGRTFGIRGTTDGDAGAVAVPAGVFAESRGTTQGNALRAYSGNITSSTLVSFYQDTSAFTGTGLLMNLGNGSGSFSGSSAKFIDLQNAGVSRMVVTADGKLGLATSSPSSLLTVAGDTYIGGSLTLAGTLKDGQNATGTSGMVLQSTGTSTRWVATSTLGFASAFTTSAQLAAILSDETGTGNVVFSDASVFTGTSTFQNIAASGVITAPALISTTTLTIDSATTSALTIGTGANAKTITVGNVTGATALNFNTGTGGSTFTTTNGAFNLLTGTGAINIGADAAAKTITIGNGTGATSLVLNAGTGAINIGTNAIARTTTIGNNTGASGLVFNAGTAGSVFSTGNVAIGTTSTSSRLTIVGAAGSSNVLTLASSTGSTTLAMLANGNLELPGQLISAGINWTARTAASSSSWASVTYGNGRFVAIGPSAVMYSPDGVNWATSTAAAVNSWISVTYGNGLFVAVSQDGTNRVMTSPDGITWTIRIATEASSWTSVTYGNGLFVAVANGGTNRVMTSPDGITWTARSAAQANFWNSITYGNSLFVAVSIDGTNRVMTSPDGITWTARSAAQANLWTSVTYSKGLFVAVAVTGVSRVMTSPDGITWTPQTAAEANAWQSVTYGNGLFVAVSNDGTNRVMTSPDGITWTARSASEANSWVSVTYGNGLFVAVAQTGTNRVMTSGFTETSALAHNNIYQGGTTFMGGLRAGTTTASVASIFLQSQAGINPFAIASSSGASLLTLTQAGNLGIGTTTPNSPLTIKQANDTDGISVFGSTVPNNYFKMYLNNLGNPRFESNGAMVFDTNTYGNGGIYFRSGTDGLFFNDGATRNTSFNSGQLHLQSSGNVGIGTTTGSSRLTVIGAASSTNSFTVASSSGATTLAMLANGNLELPGQLISAGINWVARSAAEANYWFAITYGNGLFVAVAQTGTNRVMTSPDGITWTARSAAQANLWTSVTYGNGLFVAVSADGANRVMTSPDGITWTIRSAAEANTWYSVTYGNGLFVAISSDGTNRVMTSPDGITWTARSAAQANSWVSVTYGNGLFVAISSDGTNKVMTSPDGITWTARTAAEANPWFAITYGNGLFVAVADTGTNRVMTSPDGITWTGRLAPATLGGFGVSSITYGNGLFVAVSQGGTDRVMTSPDGITWTARAAAEATQWNSVAYGNGRFVAVAFSGTNRVMTSGFTETSALAHNNIYQGGTTFMGGLRAGTTTASVASIFLQSQAGINPFAIASSTGASLLTLTQAGNLGIGTTTPAGRLSMENLGLAGAGIAGTDQFFTFANGTASAIQYGNRAYLKTTNSTTTVLVGDIIRLEDSTTYANTVRGLEVQVERGTNTLGENTAISGFARTFGLRGVTEGDAGAVFEPAGVYGETQGTTQGNAIRGYSSTITTAALLKLFQDSSAFTGTGLLMNFGNSGGSFSSTTASRFIDLQNAGTSRFTVGAYGMLTIGDGTTGQNAGLQIGNGGICVDNDGTCTASTTGRITSVSTASGNSDLAEMYFSSEDLLPGEVVYMKGGLSVGRATTETKDLVFGVVSTEPGLLLGHDDTSLVAGEAGYPIALSGRVPVRLSTENGPIKAGDELMLSSLPGVVMKATSTGKVVGIALEDFDAARAYSDTFINQFGENIIVPNYTPINRESDPRINDGCYYSGGGTAEEAPCVPLTTLTEAEQYDEADALALAEAKAEALADLAKVPSEQEMVGETEVEVGQIIMFVDLGYRYVDAKGVAMITALLATTTNATAAEDTIWSRLVTLAENFVDGVLSVLTLKADKVETKELCVEGVCVNASELEELLKRENPEAVVEVHEAPPDQDEGEGGGASTESAPTEPETPVQPGSGEAEGGSTSGSIDTTEADTGPVAETPPVAPAESVPPTEPEPELEPEPTPASTEEPISGEASGT